MLPNVTASQKLKGLYKLKHSENKDKIDKTPKKIHILAQSEL